MINEEDLRGELDHHQHSNEGYFAKRFCISKSPVCEALNLLESIGVINIVPRRGSFVAEFSINDIEEICELREALEPLAVQNEVIDTKVLERMRQAVRAAEIYQQKRDELKYIRKVTALHAALAQASSNSRLRKILENMRNQMLMPQRQIFELSSQISIKHHFQTLAAL